MQLVHRVAGAVPGRPSRHRCRPSQSAGAGGAHGEWLERRTTLAIVGVVRVARDAEGPPTRTPESAVEGQAIAREVAVALLVVDPQAGAQRGVGVKPATFPERRRGEGGEPAARGRRFPPSSSVVICGATCGSSIATRP